tara:strand:- start:493 stop:681 length:189 start_codon:yes stop_codon:yes gene_type:complete
MKKIMVKYHLEVPETHIDKICKKARCGKRDLEKDIKHMAEIAGRHRVYEFTQPFIQNKKEDS